MDIIKKRRGRPRKIIEEKPLIIIEGIEKKSRGRPRKIIEEKPLIISKEIENKPKRDIKKVEEEIEKRPRGRPRKIIEEEKPKEENIRIKNYEDIRKLIKDDKRIRKVGDDIYIGNIKIVKKIGSESKNGLILLGEIDDFKIALKIAKYNPKKTNELDTLKLVSNAVYMNKTNNFPMLYDYNIYEPVKEIDKYPKIFHKFLKNPFIIYFNELANGDLKEFLNENYKNDELVINALFQTLMSLIEYYRIIGKFHYDSHSGNFLYHKIPLTDKDFEYKYNENNIKIKNVGYLFVIWDLEKSTEFHKHTKYRVNYDIDKLLMAFFNEDDKIKGLMSKTKPYGERVKKIVNELYKSLIINDKASYYEIGYSPEKLKEMILMIYKNYINL
jgi:hypothetical protein